MSRKLIALFTVVMALAVALPAFAVSGIPSTPISVGGITPYIIPTEGPGAGGNRTCAEVGLAFFGDSDYYMYSSEREDYPDGFGASFPAGLIVDVTDGVFVSFSGFYIGAAIVKGSNEANVYVYEPQRNSDSGLAAPPNPSGGSAGLSNLTFCWNPPPTNGQWCSPGYWRQDQHGDSWAATGYSPTDNFAEKIGYPVTLSNKGIKDGATSNPTLWQVLQYPQWYGGDAFNAVGDLLSGAHPDVNFNGLRVEDSCPLS